MKQINKWRKTDVGRKRRRLRILLDAVCLVFLCVLVFTTESSAAESQCSDTINAYSAVLFITHADVRVCRCISQFTAPLEYPPRPLRHTSDTNSDFDNKTDSDCIEWCVGHFVNHLTNCKNPSAWQTLKR